jgi:hypothetical protein
MKTRIIGRYAALGVLTAIISPLALADFTYTETTQITGGSIVAMMKMAGAFSKQARQAGEPIVSTVMIKGNRMTRINAQQTEIVDLDRETITNIDHVKHQYTVMTFAQMKQQVEAAMQKAKEKQKSDNSAANTDVKFRVNVRNTGATRDVAGLNANEAILTLAVDATDKTSGQTGALAITNDMWLAPDIPGYDEAREFYKRYATKLGIVFSGGISQSMLAMQPGAGQGMADMVKEMSKLKGIPVLQVMRMGTTANGAPLPAASEAPLPAPANSPAMPSASEVAQESATAAIAGKLGLGGFGGFGKKKKADPPPAAAADQAQGATPPAAAVLVESNTQMTSFSQAAVDASKFDVPAGYKQVDPKIAD